MMRGDVFQEGVKPDQYLFLIFDVVPREMNQAPRKSPVIVLHLREHLRILVIDHPKVKTLAEIHLPLLANDLPEFFIAFRACEKTVVHKDDLVETIINKLSEWGMLLDISLFFPHDAKLTVPKTSPAGESHAEISVEQIVVWLAVLYAIRELRLKVVARTSGEHIRGIDPVEIKTREVYEHDIVAPLLMKTRKLH